MKRIFINRMALLCAILSLAAGNTQAASRIVTTETLDVNTPGSLLYEIAQLQDGDILTFDRTTVDTITLTGAGTKISITKSVTIRGNGVTINAMGEGNKASYIELKSATVQVENVHWETRLYLISSSSRMINCTFKPFFSKESSVYYYDSKTIVPGSYLSFEGCAFLTEGNEMAWVQMIVASNKATYHVYFTSCTFVNNATTRRTVMKGDAYLPATQSVTFTNCVLLDPGATDTSPSVYVYNINTNGYNVFQGVMKPYGSGPTWTPNPDSDITLALDATEEDLPLKYDEGIYKVTVGNAAHRHLPAEPFSNGMPDGVILPEKDLSGNVIEYVARNTHSGAWQDVYGDEGIGDEVVVTDIKVTFPDNGILFTDTTYQFVASVLSEKANAEQEVTWECADTRVAITPFSTGNIQASFLAEDFTEETQITVKLTAKDNGADKQPFVKEFMLTLKPYVHVEDIDLSDQAVTFGYTAGLRAVVTPANANWKELEWTVADPAVASITVEPDTDSITVKGLTAGTTTLTATAKDNKLNTKVSVNLSVNRADYSDGVFIINEDWAFHNEGSVNFLYNDGRIDYDAFKHANHTPLYALGSVAQYGAIYGDKFYIVSKNQFCFAVADARTLELHKSFAVMGGEGRSFLGVDEHTGYVGTSNGIRIVDLDELPNVPGNHVANSLIDPNPDPKRVIVLPGQDFTAIQSGSGNLTGQVATMKRVGERVFVLQQGVLHVIIAANRQVETTLNDHNYVTMTQSKDGYLWLGTSGQVPSGDLDEDFDSGNLTNYFVRLDPWTLERKVVTLPNSIKGTAATFGAWQADAFSGSSQENVLYWKGGSIMWKNPNVLEQDPLVEIHGMVIFRYDIEANRVDTVLDVSDMPRLSEEIFDPWSMYGTAFAVDPRTGELIVTIGTYAINGVPAHRNNWKILRVNPNGGQPRADAQGVIGNIISEHPLRQHYWFPAMPVFPDTHQPEFTGVAFPAIALSGAHPTDSLDLIDKVADADNMRASIVTTVLDGYNKSLINAFIWRDTLVVAARKTIPAGSPAESTELTLKFNSNGHVLTKTLTVAVQPGVATHPVTGVTLNHTTAELTVGQTLALTATVAPPDATNKTVTWTSSAPSVASVNNAGVVTALSADGTAVIIASTADGGFTATCAVSTKAASPVETNPFELNQHSLTLYPGQTVTLGLTAPQHFNVTWSSSVPSVATVSNTGEVRSLSAGTTVIIARDVAKGKVDMCTVTVLPIPASTVESVELNTSLLTLTQGETATLQVTTSPGLAGQPTTWSASNPNVADVTASGTVIAFAPGTSVIRVAIGAYSATCTVQVSAPRENTEVDNITQNSAQLFLSKNANASYYLVHLYTKHDVSLIPVYTLKVTPDGSVTFVMLRAGVNNIVVPLQYLSPATSYILEVESIREIQGKADVIHTVISAFTTTSPTGIEDVSDAQPKAWYANGTLRLENLDGYVCTVISMSGQNMHLFHVVSSDDRRRIQLQRGTYILSAQKDGVRKVFKFVVF
ncbi:MAG: Ig-like domain-containing protein [Tannerella sp.]|jgi:uncharacterized protein YjdB|nr:Ig-like domain-containing protein [Tannerella sp.]